MTIEAGFYSYIKSKSTVTDIIGTGDDARIYPGAIPQGISKPAIAVTKISGQHGLTFDGADGLARARLQVNCWAATYKAAKQLYGALWSVLHGFKGAMGSVTVKGTFVDDDSDLPPEYGADKSTIVSYGVRTDIEIWYAESVPTF